MDEGIGHSSLVKPHVVHPPTAARRLANTRCDPPANIKASHIRVGELHACHYLGARIQAHRTYAYPVALITFVLHEA